MDTNTAQVIDVGQLDRQGLKDALTALGVPWCNKAASKQLAQLLCASRCGMPCASARLLVVFCAFLLLDTGAPRCKKLEP